MLTESGCRKITDYALATGSKLTGKKKNAQLEVTLTGSNLATSRFANNAMTQNQAPQLDTISIRVLQDGRQARMDGHDLSESGVERLIENALAACKLLQADPDLLPLPEKPAKKDRKAQKKLPSYLHYDEPTAALTAAARAEQIARIISVAEAHKASAAGIYTSGESFQAIANSNELFHYERHTECQCSVTVSADDATGWAKADSPRASEVDGEKLARIATAKALAGRNPQDLAPGRYKVILEPAAVLDLLSFLWWDFCATAHIDKLSCLENKQGEQVFGSNISISDDPFHLLQSGSLVDGEGLPRQSLQLVKNGVFQDMVLGRRAAARLNKTATGHSLSEYSALGEMPLNLVVEGGISSIADMIANSPEGEQIVLLTRVWYVREVDSASKLITGMTRDGTFLVKGGASSQADSQTDQLPDLDLRPIRNLRFNVSLLDLLNNVIELGPAVRAAGEESFPAVVPTMLVRDFNFTAATRF